MSYTDALRRNNLRMLTLRLGRSLVTCMQGMRFNTPDGKAVARALAESALAASRSREACYRSGASGCGRFALNEDDNKKKADQEAAAVGNPLAALLAGSSLRGLGYYPGAIRLLS